MHININVHTSNNGLLRLPPGTVVAIRFIWNIKFSFLLIQFCVIIVHG